MIGRNYKEKIRTKFAEILQDISEENFGTSARTMMFKKIDSLDGTCSKKNPITIAFLALHELDSTAKNKSGFNSLKLPIANARSILYSALVTLRECEKSGEKFSDGFDIDLDENDDILKSALKKVVEVCNELTLVGMNALSDVVGYNGVVYDLSDNKFWDKYDAWNESMFKVSDLASVLHKHPAIIDFVIKVDKIPEIHDLLSNDSNFEVLYDSGFNKRLLLNMYSTAKSAILSKESGDKNSHYSKLGFR